MSHIQILFAFFAIYVLATEVLFLASCRFLRSGASSRLQLFALSRGLGPAVVAILIYFLFELFPGRPPSFHLTALGLVFSALGLYAKDEWRRLPGVYRDAFAAIRHALRPGARSLPLLATLFIVLASFWLSLGFPITEHDALAVAVESQIMVRNLDLSSYKAVWEPDPETGYYSRSYRAPFLHMLYAGFAFLGGDAQMDLLARTVTPVFTLYCLALLAFLVHRQWPGRAAVWAMFLFASTPLTFSSSYSHGIDPPRIYFTTLAMIWLAKLIEERGKGWRTAAMAGFICGLATFCHLLAAPALVAGTACFLLFRGTPLRRRVAAMAVVCLAAVLAGAPYYYLTNSVVLGAVGRSFSLDFLLEWREIVAPGSTEMSKGAESKEKGSKGPSQQGLQSDLAQAKARVNIGASRALDPETTPLATSPPAGLAASPRAPPAEKAAKNPPTLADGQTQRPVPSPASPAKIRGKSIRRHQDRAVFLETRGHGGSPMARFLFGRLQMFSGIEYFGFLFYFLFFALLLWPKAATKTALEWIMALTVLLTCVAVLSGARKLSWSNPRYIGSLILMGAYFAAPWLVRAEAFLATKARRAGPLLLLFALLFPVLLVTAVRGAKLELTNTGTFYRDFRSLDWIGHTLEEPAQALGGFWRDYLGIRKVFAYAGADRETQLWHAHDYFAGVLWINHNTPNAARVLVFRDSRFFYYGERQGIVWFNPEIRRPFHKKKSDRELHDFLVSEGITHILIDELSKTQVGYLRSQTGPLLANAELSMLLFEHGAAAVYGLR